MKKYDKPFKHNVPLIKDKAVVNSGKSEIAKTLEMGQNQLKVIQKIRKRKKFHQRHKEII